MSSGNDQLTEVAGYRLGERIGAGGMGEVYRAYNASLNRYAAVKILYQPELAGRFKNEAYIQSSISHPNIARLYEFAKCGDHHCIVMEYVEGETLADLLHRKRKLGNEETEDILRQIVLALVYLHKKDIIHRDIKPQNFKIQADGMVKMLDFGIAKHRYSPRFTQSGFIVGTSEYLSPEQFQQEPELKSDVWALAVMSYEMVTGYIPFEAPNPVLLQAKIRKGSFTDPKLLIPQVSDKLLLIIEKSLRVNPATRISAAGIQSILGKPAPGRDQKNSSLPGSSKKWLVTGVGSLLVLLLLFFLLSDGNETDNGGGAKGNEQLATDSSSKKAGGMVEKNSGGKMIINVPGVANAVLIMPDGSHQALPYTMIGKEGDQFRFVLHAEGYKDKPVDVVLTPRRLSYEFNLEKN